MWTRPDRDHRIQKYGPNEAHEQHVIFNYRCLKKKKTASIGESQISFIKIWDIQWVLTLGTSSKPSPSMAAPAQWVFITCLSNVPMSLCCHTFVLNVSKLIQLEILTISVPLYHLVMINRSNIWVMLFTHKWTDENIKKFGHFFYNSCNVWPKDGGLYQKNGATSGLHICAPAATWAYTSSSTFHQFWCKRPKLIRSWSY